MVYDSSANNNGVLEPGESASLAAILTNIGLNTGYEIAGKLTCPSPYITIYDSAAYWGTLAPADTVEGTSCLISASSSTPPGSDITFFIYATGLGGFTDTFEFIINIGTPGIGENRSWHQRPNVDLPIGILHDRTVKVHYDYEYPTSLRISIYEESGELAGNYEYETLQGTGNLKVDCAHLPAGVYFIRAETPHCVNVGKIVLIK